jgi:hypothetical protein
VTASAPQSSLRLPIPRRWNARQRHPNGCAAISPWFPSRSKHKQDDGGGAAVRSQPNHAADAFPTESLQIINAGSSRFELDQVGR